MNSASYNGHPIIATLCILWGSTRIMVEKLPAEVLVLLYDRSYLLFLAALR